MVSIEETNKLSEFKKDIKNERSFSEKIKNIFQSEFDEIFEDILILSKEDFMSNIMNNINQLLLDMYSEEEINDKTLNKLLKNMKMNLMTNTNIILKY